MSNFRKTFTKIVILGSIIAGIVFYVRKKLDELKKYYKNTVIFNGKELKYEDEEVFTGESIASVFSGVDVDLRNVDVQANEVTIDLFTMFSGIRIRIPADWYVVAEGTNNASGIEIRDNEENEDALILKINYKAYFSGIEVTN